MAFIDAKKLCFRYAGGSEPALDIESLSVEKGELVLLIGSSGSGKTTLLRRLADETGYKGEKSGEIELEAASFGYVWQDIYAQPVSHRVESEIVFAMENKGYDKSDMERRLAEIVAFFGLEELVHKEISELSAGELQTVNIASAIVEKPDLLLLDEPTGSLDPMAAERLSALIKKINTELGITVFIAEQRPELFYEAATRIVFMEKGRIAFDGAYDKLISKLSEEISGVGVSKKSSGNADEGGVISYLPASVRLGLELGAPKESVISRRSLREWFLNDTDKYENYLSVIENNTKNKSIKDAGYFSYKNISFRYEKKSPDVIKDCDFLIAKGSITALVGGNGSGKTTLAEIIAGVLKAYRGKAESAKVGYLPSDPGLIFTDEPFDGSGGEREWHGIELVFSREAELYILDEPTTGLDPDKKRQLISMIRHKRDEEKTVLVVTHDVEFAAKVADDMAMMYDGRIVACEKKEDFLKGNLFYTTELARLLS